MLQQIEGSRAVAKAVALCRPEVVCAYPISPQTHIIEAVGAMVKAGELSPCEFINVESEFAAMSVAIGASAAGARTFTATASQGLLFMMEALYNAGGLGLPIVMTLANRAVGAPINIWNDHSDAMAARDSGWVQLFAETNQEAADLHIQAFRLAEELSVPVMVCMDGFILTHSTERVDIPDAGPGRHLPAALTSRARCSTQTIRSPSAPWWAPRPSRKSATSLTHASSRRSADIGELGEEFAEAFGRDSGGVVHPYRSADADVVVVAMGSVLGTIKDIVDGQRDAGCASALSASRRSGPFRSKPFARRSRVPGRLSWWKRHSAWASAGCSRPMSPWR